FSFSLLLLTPLSSPPLFSSLLSLLLLSSHHSSQPSPSYQPTHHRHSTLVHYPPSLLAAPHPLFPSSSSTSLHPSASFFLPSFTLLSFTLLHPLLPLLPSALLPSTGYPSSPLTYLCPLSFSFLSFFLSLLFSSLLFFSSLLLVVILFSGSTRIRLSPPSLSPPIPLLHSCCYHKPLFLLLAPSFPPKNIYSNNTTKSIHHNLAYTPSILHILSPTTRSIHYHIIHPASIPFSHITMTVSLLPDRLSLLRFPREELEACSHAILKHIVFRAYSQSNRRTRDEPLFSYIDNSLEISIFGDHRAISSDFPKDLCPGLEISKHIYRALQVDNDDTFNSSRICTIVEPLAKAGGRHLHALDN
ncbi:MAG: hypothetical protein J3R72DRAFT_85357, partial [Linnemannia gamsii]